MNENISDSTFKIIDELMQETLNKELYENPFIKEVHRANNPLFASILPDEIFKVSHFERRFNSVFNCIWEKLAVAAGKVGMGEAYQEYVINGHLRKERQSRIQEVLNRFEYKENGKERIKPNWESEIKYILEGKGELIPTTVVCDVYAKNIKTGSAYAFELKAPLPNSDQTKVSKEKIFKLLSMEEPQVSNAFFVLPYNPYGKKEDYNWSFPKRWFDMQNDPVVLIGNDFWDFLGGSGTYNLLIREVNKFRKIYKDIIYKEYLGVQPSLQDDFSLV